METYKLKQLKKIKTLYLNGQKNIEFSDNRIKEHEFCQDKSLFLRNNTDIKKAVVSNEILFHKQDFEYLIGYKDPK